VFTADQVPVPGFLPDDEVIRKELAHYYSSVRRADDCFREVIAALDQSGQAEDTFVMFLSDHGMPLPFAKTQLYHHSTHTPLIVRLPGVTRPGSTDDDHMVSAVDFLPTLLEIMGHPHPSPAKLHGRSFAPLIGGQTQADRDHVILQYNENSGRSRHPMRGIHTREYLYLYNPWSDGNRKFATATTGTMTYRQMVKRAASEPDVAARLELFDHRVLEELYDIRNDPDCLVNLIDDPGHQETADFLRGRLADALTEMNDPVAPLMAAIADASLREAYMAAEDERFRRAKAARELRNAGSKASATAGRRKLREAIAASVPESVTKGGKCSVIVHHKIPIALGPQKLHVTLKTASTDPKSKVGQRIHREVITIGGTGEVKIEFDVPATIESDAVSVAAFIGEDYGSHLQHTNSAAIPIK
jgi:N-sulfoglucosamine sulfohydrolase